MTETYTDEALQDLAAIIAEVEGLDTDHTFVQVQSLDDVGAPQIRDGSLNCLVRTVGRAWGGGVEFEIKLYQKFDRPAKDTRRSLATLTNCADDILEILCKDGAAAAIADKNNFRWEGPFLEQNAPGSNMGAGVYAVSFRGRMLGR